MTEEAAGAAMAPEAAMRPPAEWAEAVIIPALVAGEEPFLASIATTVVKASEHV
ncbi:hypothetical protein GCM10007884_13340 [Methylobacterium brachythecii]|uniref:Uncharacterized protein n=1 Tax=Methylobacterium brachythecii TaxID=1176177 RepID=A0ABQ6CZ53_9HYPH|nr:hypothetical protein GCM10007884_13340 [Methylobacterium brachythecii]